MIVDHLFSNFTLKLELLGLLTKQVLCQGKEAWEPSMGIANGGQWFVVCRRNVFVFLFIMSCDGLGVG